MANVRRVELSGIVGLLPDIQAFNPRSTITDGPDDLFLCVLGFEPRCLTLPRLLAESGYTSVRVVFFEYETNADDNDVNRQELLSHLHAISDDVQSLTLSDPQFS